MKLNLRRLNIIPAIAPLIIFIFATHFGQAAPIPLTTTSTLTNLKEGLYHSPHGFSIHSGNSGWSALANHIKNDFVAVTYQSPKDSAALTVRVDTLNTPMTIDAYSKKWIKDYPRFGFDILDSKKVRVGQETAHLIDFVSRENQKQLRQILLVKDKKAVTLTCRGTPNTFSATVKSCNEIFRSFKWL